MNNETDIINEQIDIQEDDIALFNNGKVLKELLTDHTRRQIKRQETKDEKAEAYIFWCTDDYKENGEGFGFKDEITPERVTGEFHKLVMPRVLKDKIQQDARSKEKAEVFTPSWICNAQNNLVDEAWFGRKDVFNQECVLEDGTHDWVPTEGTISFEETDKTWEQYIRDTRMEITCGEAPYLVSRYDTTTGEPIPIAKRVGLLDRKLRVIKENTNDEKDWLKWVKIAYHNIYGYEWQGDSLLLAREALLYTFIDYYKDKFGADKTPHSNTLQSISYIISWNLWQMDGIKYVIPETCHDDVKVSSDLFDPVETRTPCPGCQTGDHRRHNGIYPKIRDWGVFDNDHKDKNGLTGKERCDQYFAGYVLTHFRTKEQ